MRFSSVVISIIGVTSALSRLGLATAFLALKSKAGFSSAGGGAIWDKDSIARKVSSLAAWKIWSFSASKACWSSSVNWSSASTRHWKWGKPNLVNWLARLGRWFFRWCSVSTDEGPLMINSPPWERTCRCWYMLLKPWLAQGPSSKASW